MGLQGIPRDSKGFQGTPRDSKGFQGTPRDSKGLHGTPRDSTGLQGTPRDSKGLESAVSPLSISPYKTPLFVFIAPCFIMPTNLGATGAQFINGSKIARTRCHKCRSIERYDDFRCSFVYESKFSHPPP
jgi:hypothetical protein